MQLLVYYSCRFALSPITFPWGTLMDARKWANQGRGLVGTMLGFQMLEQNMWLEKRSVVFAPGTLVAPKY